MSWLKVQSFVCEATAFAAEVAAKSGSIFGW
jgi:hypothetical protein